MVGAYVRMRQQQKRDEGSKKAFTHTSPRTLLGVLRLAQALARLRFAEEVIAEDVDEALRLTEVSKASLYADENRRDDHTPSSKIYHLIKSMEASGAAAVGDGTRGELDLRRVRERVLAKGFTADQFEQAIDEYSMLDVSSTAFESTTRMLTTPHRSGKLLAKAQDWSSSRLVTKTKTWMRTTTSKRCDSEDGSRISGYGAQWRLQTHLALGTRLVVGKHVHESERIAIRTISGSLSLIIVKT